VAREVAPDARVVYVDNDQVAVTESRDLLEGTAGVTVIEADLREPDSILKHDEVRRLIDFAEPVALLIVSVLPFVPDHANPRALLARYRDHLSSGSYVALSHATVDDATPEAREQVVEVARSYDETSDPAVTRTRAEFTGFFDGLHILPPGVVYAPDWRPERPVDTDDPARPCNYAAIGYKP
jgi:S-adenosyl methyltransferase